jgi:hypothetical protein
VDGVQGSGRQDRAWKARGTPPLLRQYKR